MEPGSIIWFAPGERVIFPRYQNDVGTLPKEFLPNATWPPSATLWRCSKPAPKHVRPDLSRIALIGHSAGGNLAAQIAAVASDPHSGLPRPRLVIALMPGEVLPSREPSARTHCTLNPAAGGRRRGRFSGGRPPRTADLHQASGIPRSRKRFLLFRSDRHGFPPIVAEHTAPTAANRRLDTGEGLFRSFQMSLGEVNAHRPCRVLANCRRSPRNGFCWAYVR